jgi:hypothetical protein
MTLFDLGAEHDGSRSIRIRVDAIRRQTLIDIGDEINDDIRPAAAIEHLAHCLSALSESNHVGHVVRADMELEGIENDFRLGYATAVISVEEAVMLRDAINRAITAAIVHTPTRVA